MTLTGAGLFFIGMSFGVGITAFLTAAKRADEMAERMQAQKGRWQ